MQQIIFEGYALILKEFVTDHADSIHVFGDVLGKLGSDVISRILHMVSDDMEKNVVLNFTITLPGKKIFKRFSFVHLTIMKLLLGCMVDTVKKKKIMCLMWLDFKIINQVILVCIVYLLFQDICQILII